MCKEAQLECYNKATERFMKNMELDKNKADASAYHDDEKEKRQNREGMIIL